MTSLAAAPSSGARSQAATRRGGYFAESRAPRYSLLFAMPLLVAYEGLASFVAGPHAQLQLRNGAEVLMRELAFTVAGPRGPLALMAVILILSAAAVWRDVRKNGGALRVSVFVRMLLESAALALVFGAIVGLATARLLGAFQLLAITPKSPIASMDASTKLMLALGAGVWEELLFRVLLVSALAWGARIVLGFGRAAAGVLAAVVGALVFSAFHYIGPYGDSLQLQSFVFRAISGLAFSALYLTRGFGITAWTHALYDAFLMLG